MDKIIIVVKDGLVQDVYADVVPYSVDVEIVDLDAHDDISLAYAYERLGVAEQHLTKIY